MLVRTIFFFSFFLYLNLSKFVVHPAIVHAKSCRCHLFIESSFIIWRMQFCWLFFAFFRCHSIRAHRYFHEKFNKNAKQALGNCYRWDKFTRNMCSVADRKCAHWKWIFIFIVHTQFRHGEKMLLTPHKIPDVHSTGAVLSSKLMKRFVLSCLSSYNLTV